ncbi:MAG: DsbC family protein [Steroidobacteraceae bacterium]
MSTGIHKRLVARCVGVPAAARAIAAGTLAAWFAVAAVSADLPIGAVSPAPAVAARGPDAVAPTPVPGIVEVRRGAEIVYMSRDGKYVFTGDMYRVAGHSDLTEMRRRELRRELIGQVPESQMVVFSPPDAKYTVTVFTDVDCVYCRALQRQIKDYNRLGIKVRYVFFPRTGPHTGSWYKAEQVWCSPDRRAALTRAKLGEPLDTKPCGHTPVAREYALGESIGLEGTPGIVAANGALLGGYLPPDALLTALQQSALPPTDAGTGAPSSRN